MREPSSLDEESRVFTRGVGEVPRIDAWRRKGIGRPKSDAADTLGLQQDDADGDAVVAAIPSRSYSGTVTTFQAADFAGHMVAGRYELVRELGHGSFGRTFLAHDRPEERTVALKVLDRRGAADWKAYELFEREASVLRSLRHHGVPEVHDRFRDVWDGAPAAFLVMEYVEGVSLGQMIAEQRQLSPGEVVHLFLELLGILDYLHGRVPPLLHRDIKPSNIVVRPDGTPALIDFGSVRRVFLDPEEAGSTVVGTYGYMPYEQYMGQASPASDLYALGATMLHLLTGRPPRDFMSTEGRIEVPNPLPGDQRLRPILATMLRPSPAERFASAREVREALLSPTLSAGTALPITLARPRAVTPIDPELAALPPAPRVVEGSTAELLDRVAPSAWQLMDTSVKSDEDVGITEVLSLIFFSILTAGILPITFLSIARTWRRRLRRFLRDGTPASAEILSIRLEKIAFDQHLARVSYEFEADGRLYRDVDQVLPVIADRWRPGDRVQVLYIPERDYDSVILGK